MAERPVGIENMAVSSDIGVTQQNMKDDGKEENDIRGGQSNPKLDAPKKKTTFKITSVTKSSQRGGSGDLTQDNDLDSLDDLDETVDSHTEDLSSEIYDTNSKATDMDNQDNPLTPEEVLVKEKPARFKVVKVETKEPFKRGRWVCYDYLDDKAEAKQEEIHVNSGNSSAANSVHYVHGVDDPSKNPLIAGATGTMSSQPQPTTVPDGSNQGDVFQPIQPPPSSQPGTIPAGQTNVSSNHIAQPSASVPYPAQPGQSAGHSLPLMAKPSNSSLISRISAPNLPNPQPGQTQTNQTLPGNSTYSGPSGQSHAGPASKGGAAIPPNVHSQTGAAAGSVFSQQTLQSAMQTNEYANNAVGQGQGQVSGGQNQQGMYDASSQSQQGYNSAAVSSASGNLSMAQQNHLSSNASSQQQQKGYNSDIGTKQSGSNIALSLPRSDRGDEAMTQLLGSELELAVNSIANTSADDDITEEALLEYFSNVSTYGGSGLFPPLLEESSG